MMDVSPDTHILESLRRGERLDYALLIGEAVDNAFDAGALSIEIDISPKVIAFRDDGRGIKSENISNLFRLGRHGGMETTKLGQFGIGIKFQAVRAGDILRVDSIAASSHVTAFINWADIQRTGQWKVPLPRTHDELSSVEGGVSARASANAPFIFFDHIGAMGAHNGHAHMSLQAVRFTTVGEEVLLDKVVVAHLRMDLASLHLLKEAVAKLELLVQAPASPRQN